MPEILGLKDNEKSMYAFVLENWPATPLEVAEQFKEDLSTREKKRRASTKYAYYLKKLIEKKLLLSKKAGNSIIVWPVMVEKYRAIHDILQQHEPEHLAMIYQKHKEGEKHA
jgi:sugar-specific transcriptional regulator TrmB